MESTCKKDAQKMQKSNDYKPIAAPVVDVADQLPEKNMALEVKDGLIGLARKQLLNECYEL